MKSLIDIQDVQGCVFSQAGSPLDDRLLLGLDGVRLNKLRMHGYEVIKRYKLKGVSSQRVAVIGLCDLLHF